MSLPQRFAFVVLALSLGATAACTREPISRVAKYAPYQTANAAESARVEREYNDLLHTEDLPDEIRILTNTLPPGVDLFQGELRVSSQSPVDVAGTFDVTFRSSQDEVSLVPYMKKLGHAIRADILSIEPHTAPDNKDKIVRVTGYAFRHKSGKI